MATTTVMNKTPSLPPPVCANPRAVDQDVRVSGYPQLARFQSRYHEYSIFRKFSRLNMLNLLYLQAELKHLELELETTEEDDYASGRQPRQGYHSNWEALRSSLKSADDAITVDNHQCHTLIKIRSLLKEYSMDFERALLLTVSILLKK
jgi:hypothetical protein